MAVVRDMGNTDDSEFASAVATAAASVTATSGGSCVGAPMDDLGRSRVKSDATEPTGRAPSRRRTGSKVRNVDRVSGSSVGGGGGGCRSDRRKDANSFVHASIFPGENFAFTWQCNVLVLAEDKEKAKFHLGQLQAKVRRAESVYTVSHAEITHTPFGRYFEAHFLGNAESASAERCVIGLIARRPSQGHHFVVGVASCFGENRLGRSSY